MPNPEIQPSPELQPRDPPIPVQATWKVFRLRDQGEKLSRVAVLHTEQRGVLTLWRQDKGALNAKLTHVSGYPVLDNLYEVQVLRYDIKGLLLGGVVLNSKSGAAYELPQSWWCLLESLSQPSAPQQGQDF